MITQGRATLHQTALGHRYLSVPGGQQILLTTYEALAREKLVSRDTRFPISLGQPLAATELGRTLLHSLPPPPVAPVPGGSLRPVPARPPHRSGAR